MGDTVAKHGVTWKKCVGLTIDPVALHGYNVLPKLNLYGLTTKTPLDYFLHMFPPIFGDIAEALIAEGKSKTRGQIFLVGAGDIMMYLGIKLYRVAYPQDGPVED